jgi:hypothetical protein
MKQEKLPLIMGVAGGLVALGLGYGLGNMLPRAEAGTGPGAGVAAAAGDPGAHATRHGALGQGSPGGRAQVGEGLPASIPPGEKWGLEELVDFAMDLAERSWMENLSQTPPLLELAQHVNPAEIPALLDELEERMPMSKAAQLRNLLLSLYTRADPAKAWDFAWSREEKRSVYGRAPSFVIREWLHVAPYEALQAARAKAAEGEGEQYYLSALRFLAQDDPMFVWRELEGDKTLEEHRKAWLRGEVMKTLLEEDPGKATALLETMEHDQERPRVFARIAGEISVKDLEGALRFIEEQGSSEYEKRQATQHVVSDLIYRDLDAAMELYTKLGVDGMNHYMAQRIVEKLAEKDPERAWEWLQGLPAQSYNYALRGFGQQMDPDDPQPVLEKLLSIPEKSARETALSAALSDLARKDPQRALEIIEEHGITDESDHMLTQVFQEWGSKNGPEAAARLGQMARGQEEFPVNLARQVAMGWAEVSPREALEWTLQQPENVQADLVEVSIQSWAKHDLEGAGQWINSLGDGELRDEAIEGFTRQVARVDHLAAMEWAGSITDEKTRERQLMNMGRSWKRADLQGARAWAQANDLPEKVKKEMLKEED